MNRRGFTLVEIMIVVAIIALLAAIAIPNLLAAKRTANDGASLANIRTLSTAAETYATAHNGTFPVSVPELAGYAAAATTLCGATVQGFAYTCTLAADDYTIIAAAAPCGVGGSKRHTVIRGGAITTADCP